MQRTGSGAVLASEGLDLAPEQDVAAGDAAEQKLNADLKDQLQDGQGLLDVPKQDGMQQEASGALPPAANPLDQRISTFHRSKQARNRFARSQAPFGKRSKSMFTKDVAMDKHIMETLNEYVKATAEIDEHWPVVRGREKVDGVQMAKLRNRAKANEAEGGQTVVEEAADTSYNQDLLGVVSQINQS